MGTLCGASSSAQTSLAEQHAALQEWYILWATRLAAFKRTFDMLAATVSIDTARTGTAATTSDVLYVGPIDASVPVGVVGQSGVFESDIYMPDMSRLEQRRAFLSSGHLARARVHHVSADVEIVTEALARALTGVAGSIPTAGDPGVRAGLFTKLGAVPHRIWGLRRACPFDGSHSSRIVPPARPVLPIVVAHQRSTSAYSTHAYAYALPLRPCHVFCSDR